MMSGKTDAGLAGTATRGVALAAGLVLLTGLSGCAGVDLEADAELIGELRAETSYFPDAPPSATLVLAEHKDGAGAVHAALIITASERVIYDPSGSFTHPETRRLGDVVYGASDEIVEQFALHNADRNHDAVLRSIALEPSEAEWMLDKARQKGGAAPGFCAKYVADVLRASPRFASMRDTFWPSNVLEDFEQVAEVETRVVTDTDSFTRIDD